MVFWTISVTKVFLKCTHIYNIKDMRLYELPISIGTAAITRLDVLQTKQLQIPKFSNATWLSYIMQWFCIDRSDKKLFEQVIVRPFEVDGGNHQTIWSNCQTCFYVSALDAKNNFGLMKASNAETSPSLDHQTIESKKKNLKICEGLIWKW